MGTMVQRGARPRQGTDRANNCCSATPRFGVRHGFGAGAWPPDPPPAPAASPPVRIATILPMADHVLANYWRRR
jgi:hypothetical protein